MNRRNPDRISLLVDGELEAWELKGTLQALEQDAEMQACWRNYHLIGDAIRGHLPNPVCLDLSERVTQALKHEPTYFQPRNPVPSAPSTATGLTRTKTAVGFALAASLSAIAVVGVMDIGQSDAPGAPTGLAAAPAAVQTTPAATAAAQETAPRFMYTFTADASTMPASVPPAGSLPAPSAGSEAPRVHTVAVARGLPLASDLTDYLMNYQRYAAHHDKEDTLSYLRLVGYSE